MAYGDKPKTVDSILADLAVKNAETVAKNKLLHKKVMIKRDIPLDPRAVRGYGLNKNVGD